ncbi:galactoside O-acetyltransferase [Marinobacter pelagius]|uniref:Galactoside O-acetyltransferase n=1 Tax=Marinobacter pelagius TaxID=379482 RepID=A0A366GDL1_9GAMM|nr:acyltransferase [Marinobacter pelagius]RBP25032.1 galactoside O-acetyltransferase [Marinobacter pelagius]
MAYLSKDTLKALGFKAVGENVKVSDKASIYNPETIELGDHSRIDDFCVVSGKVSIGKYCHITPMCLVAGGSPGITLSDFCTLAYGVKVFAQSDDYSGSTMVNSLVPKQFKNEYLAEVLLERQVIVGAGSIIFPGVIIGEGCSIGAMTLVNKSTQPWGIYAGNPARRIKDRKQDLLELEAQFLKGKQE